MNVIASVCHGAGISADALSKKMGMRRALVDACIADDAASRLSGSTLKILQAFGGRVVLDAEYLAVQIDLPTIDRLLSDNGFRASIGLEPWPAMLSDVRRYAEGLREKGMSYAEIAAELERQFIPTSEGLRVWNRANISRFVSAGNDRIVTVGPDLIADWRRSCARELVMLAAWFSPTAPMRFQIEADVFDRVVIRSGEKMPAFCKRWMIEALESHLDPGAVQPFFAESDLAD